MKKTIIFAVLIALFGSLCLPANAAAASHPKKKKAVTMSKYSKRVAKAQKGSFFHRNFGSGHKHHGHYAKPALTKPKLVHA